MPVPGLRPDTVPPRTLMCADGLDHVPPGVALARTIVDDTQRLSGPESGAGVTFTVISFVAALVPHVLDTV